MAPPLLLGGAVGRRGVGAKGAKKLPSGRFTGGFFTPHGGVSGGASFYLHGRQFCGFAGPYGPGPASAVAPFSVNTKAMKKRRRKPGRPHTGHDPMVGVRVPRKMLKKIAKVADALSADRSTAIRSILEAGLDSGRVIGLLQSGKGRGWTGEIAMGIMAQFKASKAAEHATRAAPAKRPQAEIKALRAAEDAVDRLSRIGDRLALKQAHKPSKSEATWIEPKPPCAISRAPPEAYEACCAKRAPETATKKKTERGRGARDSGASDQPLTGKALSQSTLQQDER
jgi:hypothetical protein